MILLNLKKRTQRVVNMFGNIRPTANLVISSDSAHKTLLMPKRRQLVKQNTRNRHILIFIINKMTEKC